MLLIEEAEEVCLNLFFNEFIMEKQKSEKYIALDAASKQAFKETPEQMVRSLQVVFCKDRYRYWAFTPDKKTD